MAKAKKATAKKATGTKTATAAKAKTAKAPAKKAAAKSTTATTKKAAPKKAAAKTGAKGGGNSAFNKPLEASAALAAVIGTKPMPRTEVTKALWGYIKKNNLQDQKNKRNINADEKLKAVFGKGVVNMFEMTKLVGKHLK